MIVALMSLAAQRSSGRSSLLTAPNGSGGGGDGGGLWAVELRAARGTLRGKCGVVEPPLGVDSSQCGVANLARANDLSRSHSYHRRHSVPQLFRLDRLEKRNRRTPRRREVLGR